MANDHDEYQAAVADYDKCKRDFNAARTAMFKAEDRMKIAERKVFAPYYVHTVDADGKRVQD